jgi:voltage-gated sodium channel
MGVIVANTIALMLRGFPGLRAAHDWWLIWVDYAFSVYFVLEMLIKHGLLGLRGFWRSGWNRFDFAIVVASLPVLVSPWWGPHDVGALLVLRCARLLRLLRGFRFIPERDRLWTGIKRALRASVGVFLALIVYNLILGLGAHAMFSRIVPEHFENPVIAMYSLFKIFTVEGWFEIPDQIAAVAGPGMALFARAYFVFAVVTGGILGLSLANAVFVDEMTMDNNDELEDTVKQLSQRLAAADERQHRELLQLQQQLDRVLERLPRG